jgi:hypothetical protein
MSDRKRLRASVPFSAWCVLVLGLLVFGPGRQLGFGLQEAGDAAQPDDAEIKESATKLHTIMTALIDSHNLAGHFPTAGSGWGYDQDQDSVRWYKHRPNLSWRVSLLPLIGETELFRQFNHDEPWDSPHIRLLLERMPEFYRTPGSAADAGFTNYLGVAGPNAAFHPTAGTYIGDFTDGTVTTLMLVEVPDAQAVPWTKPDDFRVGDDHAAIAINTLVGLREGGFLGCTADSSTYLISGEIPQESLRMLLIRNDERLMTPDEREKWLRYVAPK